MSVENYNDRLRIVYNKLVNSRVIKQRETDEEALKYFETECNKALPKNQHELEICDVIKSMYHADKTSFAKCIITMPQYVLLTEARAIVFLFNIQNLIYIEWNKNSQQYIVRKNDRDVKDIKDKKPDTMKYSEPFNKSKNTKKFPKDTNRKYQHDEILNRLEAIERTIEYKKTELTKLEQVEPDIEDVNEQKSNAVWADAVADKQ